MKFCFASMNMISGNDLQMEIWEGARLVNSCSARGEENSYV